MPRVGSSADPWKEFGFPIWRSADPWTTGRQRKVDGMDRANRREPLADAVRVNAMLSADATDCQVVPARVQDEAALGRTLTRAFMDDPVPEWICGDEALRERMLARFYRLLLRRVARHDEVWTTADRSGAAIWLPPGSERLGVGDQLVLMWSLAFARLATSAPRVVSGLIRADDAHPRQPPHWYLMVLGVDPASQGRGYGSRLLAPVLDRCGTDGVGAYLESSKESNIPFYARHGFRVTGEIELPSGPTIYSMWREP